MNKIIQHICDGIIYNDNLRYLTIVSMTSWTKRINTINPVIESILSGNVLPDKIIINLAISEFPNKFNSLPQNLQELINNNSIIEINWLTNNTLVWKKSIPTLYKYPNSSVICIDDDFIYPKDFVETFIQRHKEEPNKPIVGIMWQNHGHYQHCGCATLDRLEWFQPIIEKLNSDIYKIGDEDTFFTYCWAKNNIVPIYAGKKYHENMETISGSNEVGYSKEHKMLPTYNWLLCEKYIK